MTNTILERACNAENLPSLPTVAIEILRLTRQDDVSVEDLAAVIQQDPALTGKMLKMVNSSLFGISREIGSVKQAVSLLGLRTVKVMALSFSLVETVGAAAGEGLDFEAYWRRSLSTAVAARLLGKITAPQVAEEAFIAGLLSELGTIAIWGCAPLQYEAVMDTCRQTQRHLTQVEVDLLGVTHARVGAALLHNWSLPQTICEAVGAHHAEGLVALDGEARQMATVVCAAALISDLFCNEVATSELEHVKLACAEYTGIDEEQLEEILASLSTHVRDVASMLSVQVGNTFDYSELQREASAHLASLSMQAEIERSDIAKKEQQSRMEAERLHEEKRAILEFASTDSLTNIANRAAFDKRLTEELNRATESGMPIGLILMDVDHFKHFNDTHGHRAGDEVLRHVGRCLKTVVRDIGFVARYGGEEFAVILAGLTHEAIQRMAESLRKELESTRVEYEQQDFTVTASFGAACVDGKASVQGLKCAQVVEAADRLLYQAKRAGRNQVAIGGMHCATGAAAFA